MTTAPLRGDEPTATCDARPGDRPARRGRRGEGAPSQGWTARDADRDRVRELAARPRSPLAPRQAGLRAAAVLGDCGLRSAELRGLVARDLRRPRANARHLRVLGLGKGGTEREVPIPEATEAALGAWLAVHPPARGRGLRDEQPLFVRFRRFPAPNRPSRCPVRPCTISCARARAPLACRSGSRTHTPRAPLGHVAARRRRPIHRVCARLGHADLRTTSRYAADQLDSLDDVADLLDRRYQASRRAGR